MVALEGRLGNEGVHDLEACGGSERHAVRDSAIEFYDGGRGELRERIVEGRDAGPVRLLGRRRARVTGGDRRLQCVWAKGTAERLGALQRRETTPDEQVVPARAILIEQQNGRSGRTDSGPQPRR